MSKKQKRGGESSGAAASGGIQSMLAAVMAFSAVVVLVGYVIMPWFDMAGVEAIDETTGEVVTLGESFELAQEQLDALLTLGGAEADVPEFRQIIDAFDGIKLSLNGIDTTLVSIGQRNILEAMGFMEFIESFMGILGGFIPGGDQAEIDAAMAEFEATLPDPAPLDYTLLFVPVAAVLALVLGGVLVRSDSISTWLVAIVVGLLGVGPMIYFYLSGIDTTLPETDTLALDAVGTVSLPTATDLLGSGYWVSLVGMLAVVIIPFVALLLMPSADKAEAS